MPILLLEQGSRHNRWGHRRQGARGKYQELIMRRGSNCPAVFCFAFIKGRSFGSAFFYFAFRVTGFFARIYGAGMFACGKGEEAAGMYACALLCACVWLAYHPDVLSQRRRIRLRMRENRFAACRALRRKPTPWTRPVKTMLFLIMFQIPFLQAFHSGLNRCRSSISITL